MREENLLPWWWLLSTHNNRDSKKFTILLQFCTHPTHHETQLSEQHWPKHWPKHKQVGSSYLVVLSPWEGHSCISWNHSPSHKQNSLEWNTTMCTFIKLRSKRHHHRLMYPFTNLLVAITTRYNLLPRQHILRMCTSLLQWHYLGNKVCR